MHENGDAPGLQQADAALRKDEKDPRLQALQAFARKMVKNSYVALQLALQEPDYWSRTRFEVDFNIELERMAARLTESKRSESHK